MILTLISLAELEGVFKGLYFFSKGVFSKGPELKKSNKDADQTGWEPSQTPRFQTEGEQRSSGSERGQEEEKYLPWSLQNWRLNVVFVPELWGSRHLFRWDGTRGVHLQPYNTERSLL